MQFMDGNTNRFSCRMKTFSAFNVGISKKLKASSLSVFFFPLFFKMVVVVQVLQFVFKN